MDPVRASVEFHGRVQGVFFRDETRRAAGGFGVTGWVKNLANGNVQAVFEGDREQVEAFLRWYDEAGPPLSKVTKKEVEWQTYTGEFDRFSVAY